MVPDDKVEYTNDHMVAVIIYRKFLHMSVVLSMVGKVDLLFCHKNNSSLLVLRSRDTLDGILD